MFKWFLRFLYLMVLTIATFYVYGSASYSRFEAYYNEYMVDEYNNPDQYLIGMNTIMGMRYHTDTPVYLFEQTEGDYQFKVALYPIGVTLDGVLTDGIMVYVYDVNITENGTKIAYPKLNISVELDRPTFKSGDQYLDVISITFDPEKEFPYSYVPNLFLLYSDNFLKVPEQDVYASIKKVTVAYSNGALNDNKQLIYNESMLFIGSNEIDLDPALIKTDDLNFNHSDYRLSLNFPNGELTDEVAQTYGLITEQFDLSAYNSLIWRSMIVYVFIVAALTYVLFFHKKVMTNVRNKRETKTNINLKTINAEPIFKEFEDKNQSGK